VHYCDCKGTTKLQLLQRVFQRMLTHERAGWDLPVPLSVSTYGEIEAGSLRHDIGVFLKLRITSIHIAVQTALALLMAAMPQIPHFTHASCIWLLLSRMNYVSIPEECHLGQCLHQCQSSTGKGSLCSVLFEVGFEHETIPAIIIRSSFFIFVLMAAYCVLKTLQSFLSNLTCISDIIH